MENREVAIRLTGVKKMYKLGQIGGGTLQGDLQSWWARIRGREDPNTKIGTDQRLVGQTFMALNGIDLTVYKGEALGIIGGTPDTSMSFAQGLGYCLACLPMGIGGYITAVAQGRCAAAGVSLVAKRPEEMSKGIIMAIMVEFYAILCLLASFLMLLFIG